MSKPGTVPKSARPQPKGGSRKGKPNKITAEVKDMVRQALDKAGGVDYLVERANDPKTAAAFLSLVGKIVPLTLQGPSGGPIALSLNGSDVHG